MTTAIAGIKFPQWWCPCQHLERQLWRACEVVTKSASKQEKQNHIKTHDYRGGLGKIIRCQSGSRHQQDLSRRLHRTYHTLSYILKLDMIVCHRTESYSVACNPNNTPWYLRMQNTYTANETNCIPIWVFQACQESLQMWHSHSNSLSNWTGRWVVAEFPRFATFSWWNISGLRIKRPQERSRAWTHISTRFNKIQEARCSARCQENS